MRWLHFISAFFIVASMQAPQTMATDRIDSDAKKSSTRGSLSPSAPVNLTYQIENGATAQSQMIAIAINTRLSSGTLLVEVAKQEGAAIIGSASQRIDLATATRPIALQMQATLLGTGEHYLVLLLTIDTEMGAMSRSFRIDLSPTDSNAAQ